MRVVSRSSDDEPSTSKDEQCVTAAMGSLNRIAPDNCEELLSSNSLSGLMVLKKMCMYSDLTARHSVRTKEAGALRDATFQIQQMCTRGVDFGIMYEADCHNREKNGMTDFNQTVTARQNHARDLLAGAAGQQGTSYELWPATTGRCYIFFYGCTNVWKPVEASGTACTTCSSDTSS